MVPYVGLVVLYEGILEPYLGLSVPSEECLELYGLLVPHGGILDPYLGVSGTI